MKLQNDLRILPLMLVLTLPSITQAQFTFTTNADDTITIIGYTGPSRGQTVESSAVSG